MILSTLSLYLFIPRSGGVPTTRDGNGTCAQAIMPSDGQVKRGWTSQPDGRGTIDIIWSCGFTMFLCSWSILCLNVAGPDDTPFRLFRRKIYLTALCFLGPEFILQIALGQWLSARHSVQDFQRSGYDQWTMKHAFFADMGGFVLHTKDWTPFPIDAKQLHYLVTNNYVKFPTVEKRKIADKNKVDGLLRIVTFCQLLWFVVNIFGRTAQGLEITCGELTAAAFIVCSIGIAFCWISKPADVTMPEILDCDVSIKDILLEAGDQARHPYNRTPLDFVSRKEWAWSLYWSNWINILRNMGIVFGPRTRPVNRFENTVSLELSHYMSWIPAGITALYTAIFFCVWNHGFPTRTEQLLWRAASVGMMGCLFAYWLITELAMSLYPAIRLRYFPPATTRDHTSEKAEPRSRMWPGQRYCVRKAKSVAACIRNNSVSRDPALDVPLKAILPLYVVGFIYCHSRAYIFVADIIELRALSPSAYQSVKWSSFFPHI